MKIQIIALLIVLTGVSCTSNRPAAGLQRSERDSIFSASAKQYLYLATKRPSTRFPKTYHPKKDTYEWSGSEWWCSGFYPGTLLYLWEQTGGDSLRSEADRMLTLLEKEQFNTTTHDLGFMLFCSFGTANRLYPSGKFDTILLNGARSLASRFSPAVGCIKSWDSKKKDDFLVIIDNMMNLELLFWATRFSGDSSFYKIAVTHANTTMKHHFRPDYSSYHVVNYHAQTGKVIEKRTAQGYADSSAWARGQAWGLYGYTVMYRATKDPVYLQQAKNIAGYVLKHLPADGIPYWDFQAPDIPNALRDASAGSVIASALLELQDYVSGGEKKQYRDAAERILTNLGKPEYFAADGSAGGFLIKHGVGHLSVNSEVDVPLTYGDYYFIEALARYKALKGNR